MSRVAIAPFLAKHVRYLQENPNQLLVEYTGVSDRWMKMSSFFRNMNRYALGNLIGSFSSFGNMKQQVDELNALIENAPKVPRTFVVWRGTGDYEIPLVNNRFMMKGFSGTSLEPRIAAGFASSPDCCLYRLELPANSPFLLIGLTSKLAHEFEVLLPLNSIFEFLGETRQEIEGQMYRIIQGRYIEHESLGDAIPDPAALPLGSILNVLINTQMRMLYDLKKRIYSLFKCDSPNSEYKEKCKALNEEYKQKTNDLLESFGRQYYSTPQELLAGVDPTFRTELLQAGGSRRKKQTRRQNRRRRGKKTYRRI